MRRHIDDDLTIRPRPARRARRAAKRAERQAWKRALPDLMTV